MHTDSIQFISTHIQRIPEISLPKKERDVILKRWLVEFHTPETPSERRKELQDNIIHSVYFLFPYFLKGRYAPTVSPDDIVQIMVVNTIDAICNFQPHLNTKFTSYLIGYLKNAISKAYKDTQVIRNPSYARKETLASLECLACGKPTEKGAEEPTPEDIDRASSKLQKVFPDLLYLEDNPFDVTALEGAVGSAPQCFRCDSEVELLKNEQVHLLAYLLTPDCSILTPREKVVIRHRFGVFGQAKLTLQEVAYQFRARGWNATKEWIHQLEKRALQKVQEEFHLQNLWALPDD